MQELARTSLHMQKVVIDSSDDSKKRLPEIEAELARTIVQRCCKRVPSALNPLAVCWRHPVSERVVMAVVAAPPPAILVGNVVRIVLCENVSVNKLICTDHMHD